MSDESGSLKAPPARMLRALVVVARDQPDIWQALTRYFRANEDVQALLDRQQRERRQQVQTVEQERRGANRRQPPTTETDVRRRQYVIVREQAGTLGG